MNEQEKAYITLQETCDIKIGDTVKVLRIAKSYEMGWRHVWIISFMDAAVNRTFEVIGKGPLNSGYELQHLGKTSSRDFHAYYPFFILEKVKQYRAWKISEVPMDALIKYTGDMHENPAHIIGINPLYHSILDSGKYNNVYSPEKAFAQFEHSIDGGKTWLPCGVEIKN